MDCSLLCPWDLPVKNKGMNCHFLLHEFFLTQGSNLHLLCLLLGRQILYHWATWEAHPEHQIPQLICFITRSLYLFTSISPFPGKLPGGSARKGSTCNVEDLRLIPGSEDPLEKEMATHSSVLGKSHGQRSLEVYSPWGHKESDTTEWLSPHFLHPFSPW